MTSSTHTAYHFHILIANNYFSFLNFSYLPHLGPKDIESNLVQYLYSTIFYTLESTHFNKTIKMLSFTWRWLYVQVIYARTAFLFSNYNLSTYIRLRRSIILKIKYVFLVGICTYCVCLYVYIKFTYYAQHESNRLNDARAFHIMFNRLNS